MDEHEEKTSVKTPLFLWLVSIFLITINVLMIFIVSVTIYGTKGIGFLENILLIDVIAEEIKQGNLVFFIAKISGHLFAIFSIFLLIRMIRKGFYFFISSQIFLLLLPFIFLRSLGMQYLFMSFFISLIFSVFFVLIFSLYVSKMK